MKFEFSAGGIVYKRDPSAPFGNTRDKSSGQANIYILVSQHSQHHGWIFPKGLIGDHIKGEKKEDTAVREVKEETGIEARIIQELDPVTYWYVFNKEKIKKTVCYYIMEYLGGNFEQRDMEMENVEWVEIEKVMEKLTYKSDREVFIKAKPIVKKLLSL